ncbi:helix-turn-helix domain-containing protein [Facilibium subflavum]|uniref:helix-turn-helix domain-containing protein n=1 Tax=Facilibium subflavum TaxID=2219058 RepID=UPI000E658776|nr:helix-turn-helix domain-containing protein [Facilibium subflavum]
MTATMHYKLKQGNSSKQTFPLREVVKKRVQQLYRNSSLDGLESGKVYHLIMEETEWSMIEVSLEFTGYNISRSAHILGLNRVTFLQQLKQYKYAQTHIPCSESYSLG